MRQRFTTAIALAAFLAVSQLGAQSSRTADVQFKAAQHKEQVEGDLKGAIEQYKKLAEGKDRAIAAKALIQMAECYQKLGNGESRKIYERVVREYADQNEAVAKARAGLGSAGSTSATMRQLSHWSATEAFGYYNISPDGQWLGGTDWIKGDLVMVHVTSGEIRRLVTATAEMGPDHWGETPLISPDRRQVAFWWFDYKDVNADYDGELRLMPNEPGAKPRILCKNAYPLAWSPDGRSVLAILNPDRKNRADLAWVSVNDGSIRVIKTIEPWQKLARVSLSPDGLYIAYSKPARQGSQESDIYLLSKDGSSQKEVISGDVNEEPVWSPDGNRLLFSSNRSGAFGLWSVPVRDGNRAGVPSLLKAGTGKIRAFGITPSGSFYYGHSEGLDQIFVAGMDPASAKARGPATESFVGVLPAWSRDGKWLAYKRPHLEGGQGFDLIVHSIGNGADRVISHQMADGLLWLLDGSLEYGVFGGGTKRVSVSSNEPKEITELIGLPVGVTRPVGALSPDDKLLYRPANQDAKNPATPREGFEIIDAQTGLRKQWFAVSGGVGGGGLSPDGRTFLYVAPGKDEKSGRLMRIGVDGAGEKEILATIPRNLRALAWTSDGQGVLFGQADDKGVSRIMRIPAQGGQAEFTGISAERLQTFAVSPDGSRIAYSANSRHDEVWALDNVLAGLK